jgi:hypothetical protein
MKMPSYARYPPDRKYHTRQLIIGVLVFVIVWSLALISMALTLNKAGSSAREPYHRPGKITASKESRDSANPLRNGTVDQKDEVAKEIRGIELLISSPVPNDDPIQIVYAHKNISSTSMHKSSKGIVLLLHACTHSATKFFSPSPSTCPNCLGLSEELRIVSIVIEMGYMPVAVSSVDRKSGCWSTSRDVHRIEAVLKHDLIRGFLMNEGSNIFAIGASSGGAFAAELATRDVVNAALIMVMSLSDGVIRKLRTSPKPIYLAPMPRDKGTMKLVMKNYRDLESVKAFIILDTTSCGSLPVTTRYLLQRVPGMTTDAGDELISLLKKAGHIDSSDTIKVDPTHSEWRKIVSPYNSTHWLNKFDLKPGCSPLAKALHRAWAFHEYCSEVVYPALRFFEELLH